jgi:hypothetical protein
LQWILLLEEYGVTFDYLPGKEKVVSFADNLYHLDNDSLKMQEETRSINASLRIRKHQHPLDPKKQAKVKELELREKGLA